MLCAIGLAVAAAAAATPRAPVAGPSAVAPSTPQASEATNPSALPRFDAYPVTAPTSTPAAKPNFESAPPAARAYRSSMEAAMAKGPVFAGTVSLARWGCGSGCENWALIDRTTGTITVPAAPLQPLDYNLPCERELLEFRPDSRLLLVHRADDGRVTTHAMLWSDDAHALTPLARVVTTTAEFCARRS